MSHKQNSPTKEIIKSYVMKNGGRTAALEIIVKIAELQGQLAKYVGDTDYDRKKIIRLRCDITYAMKMLDYIFGITNDEWLEGHTLANMAILEQIEGGTKC